ncbi:MAG: SDR family oxidoreductase [Opitutales bacterium]|nr:SDR family oxidoreductase [Opitutales bacterium]
MRILVTGGAGFIGSHVVESYEEEAAVRVLDDFRSGYERNLMGRKCRFVNGSIENPDILLDVMAGVDVVFHLAALVSVPESVKYPRRCVDINVSGTLNVLEAASKSGVRKVVFASSAAVYGDNPEVPKRETMLPEPKSPYAVTKLDGEYYLDFYRRETGLETVALRFFNVFGPRQDPKGPYAAAVPIFIERALQGEPITVFGDGEQTRDFIYVKDIVSALRFAAENPAASGVFNVGYGERLSINQLAQTIIGLSGSHSGIHYEDERPGDVKDSMASAEKLMALGWEPRYNLASGLQATLKSYRS